MKYIRTKDGVYDTSKGIYTPSIKMWAIGTVTIYDDQIIAQSENLEELCDEYVVEYFVSENVIQIRCAELQWAKTEFERNKKGTIYGAIRVASKGLIYVAKLNSKGEFELI